MPIRVQAPAKINLTLDITGRLPNGYHTVEMVMHTISLTDTVEVSKSDGLHIRIEGADLPVDPTNTAWKAAGVFAEALGVAPHFDILLQKRIPMQAGLAGGSADAAGVLVALNLLHNSPFSVEQLAQMGAKIGADVPFCVIGGAAYAYGIGTDLKPLPLLPDCYIVVAKPHCGVSTAAAYSAADALPYPTDTKSDVMTKSLETGNIRLIGANMYNRFAEVLHITEVETLTAAMRQMGALGAEMTGSGSAVIGIFEDMHTAEQCANALRDMTASTDVCTPWNGGPQPID